MISLVNGHVQNAQSANIVPLGSIEFTLNTDATVIASPFGQVMAAIPVRLYFDANCNVITTGSVNRIWSNLELNPQQSPSLLGTWYTVNFYDANGCRVNQTPQTWLFTQAAGSTVDIGTMTAIDVPGIVYYPVVGGGTDTVLNLTTSGTLAALGAGQNLFVTCTGGGAGISEALPTAVGVAGQKIRLIKIDAGVGVVSVTGAAGGTVGLSNQYQYVEVESDGATWYVVGNN